MGLIHIDLFVTLDGVAQAPGGPDEDPTQEFAFGGWQAPMFDPVIDEQIGAGMQEMDALLLGRKTFDIFAGFWPGQENGEIADVAIHFNKLPKYVASRGKPTLDWTNSTLVGEDFEASIRAIRERHNHVRVIGSIDLVQSLFRARLFDRLNLWVFPIMLGSGKTLFGKGVVPANLKLIEPVLTSSTGAVLMRYTIAEGIPATGDMVSGDHGMQESR